MVSSPLPRRIRRRFRGRIIVLVVLQLLEAFIELLVLAQLDGLNPVSSTHIPISVLMFVSFSSTCCFVQTISVLTPNHILSNKQLIAFSSDSFHIPVHRLKD